MISSVKSVLKEKPVASGGGVNVNISVTEPVLFLRPEQVVSSRPRELAAQETMLVDV
jgi:hypothetical protein